MGIFVIRHSLTASWALEIFLRGCQLRAHLRLLQPQLTVWLWDARRGRGSREAQRGSGQGWGRTCQAGSGVSWGSSEGVPWGVGFHFFYSRPSLQPPPQLPAPPVPAAALLGTLARRPPCGSPSGSVKGGLEIWNFRKQTPKSKYGKTGVLDGMDLWASSQGAISPASLLSPTPVLYLPAEGTSQESGDGGPGCSTLRPVWWSSLETPEEQQPLPPTPIDALTVLLG